MKYHHDHAFLQTCKEASNYLSPIEFFTISPQHKNDNIANFVLAMSFNIKKTNKVCNVER